jgi:hypothetical protein
MKTAAARVCGYANASDRKSPSRRAASSNFAKRSQFDRQHRGGKRRKWLKQVVVGYFNYHAVPTNSRALAAFRTSPNTGPAQPDWWGLLEAHDAAGRRLAPDARRRTTMAYLKKDELPPVVAIACRALARDKHLSAAHCAPTRTVRRAARTKCSAQRL